MKITSRLSSSNAIAFNGKRKRTMRKHVANPVDSKFDTWWEKTKQKQKNRRTISNSVSSIIRDLCSIQGEGGEHRRAFFFLLVTYPAGKIGGRKEGIRGEREEGVVRVLRKRGSTNRVAGNTEIRNSVPLVIFRGTVENVRAKDFPGKPLICILIEEIITFTGVWPIYKVNRLTPSAPWIFSFNVNPLININAPLSNIGRVCLNFWIELNRFSSPHACTQSLIEEEFDRNFPFEILFLLSLSFSLFVLPPPRFLRTIISWLRNRLRLSNSICRGIGIVRHDETLGLKKC